MKWVSRILLVLILASCKKEEVKIQSRIDRYWYTGTAGDIPNVFGVRGTMTVPNFGGGAKDKSIWWGFYYNSVNGERRWSQIGVAKNQTWGLSSVFHWYKLGGGGEYTPDLTLMTNGATLHVGDRITFTTENIPGTNLWDYSWNNSVIYRADMGIDRGYKIELYAEINNDKVSNFPDVLIDPALEWKDSIGVWHSLDLAIVRSSAIPMKGKEQGLPKVNQLEFGRGQVLPPGTLLWSNN